MLGKLHKEVLRKLSENDGKVPPELLAFISRRSEGTVETARITIISAAAV
jgi:hypothetical protein